MTGTELMIAIGGGFFAAFLLGWLAGWLTLRASVPAPSRAPAQRPAPADDARLAAAEREAGVAREDLRQATIEIEELRAYIDRKLTGRPDGTPGA